MSRIDSGKVNVFPTALRTQEGSGKFTSENNITGIIRAVANNSYIVSYPSGNLWSGDWEFVIFGYYFKTNGLGVDSGSNIYATITLDNSGRLINPNGTSVLDEGGEFTGLVISPDNPGPDTDTQHSIQLISNSAVCHNSLYEIEAKNIQVNLSSGTDDLQSRMNNISTYIGEPYDMTKGSIKQRIGDTEDHIGTYTNQNTIAHRLTTNETNIATNTSDIATTNSRIDNNCVLRNRTQGTNVMTSNIQFAVDAAEEYNDKGITFGTGSTGIGVRQEGSTNSVMGIRAESSIDLGVGSTTSTRLSINNNSTTTYNSISPNNNEQLDLGSSSQKFRNIYGNTFSGNSANATESVRLGHETIGQAPTGTTVVTSKTMYLSNGVATEGITITFSDDNPSGGKNGDIWFKYSNL